MSTQLRKSVATKKVVAKVASDVEVADSKATVASNAADSSKKKVTKKVSTSVLASPAVSPVASPSSSNAVSDDTEQSVVKSVSKGKVTAKPAAKSPVASPAKKKAAPKKTAAKSPSKRVASKSPAASPSSKKKTAKKTVAKKTAVAKGKVSSKRVSTKKSGKTVVKKANTKPKSKRAHNNKLTPIEQSGLGIGSARVKSVLMNTSLNPREHKVRLALIAAENKPRKPKPTKENPEPEMPAQGPQTPVDKLPADILNVIREAEQVHEDQLMKEYERHPYDESTPTGVKYYTARKTAQDAFAVEYKQAKKDKVEFDKSFDLHAFNESFDKNFYSDASFAAWKSENDGYSLNKVNDDGTNKYNQWTRATALVNKLCTRLSGNTRSIIACFLDRIVEQYALNGIHNCLAANRHIIQLPHALDQTDGFDERVPLDRYVRTFDNYTNAHAWIKACVETRAEVKELRDKGAEEIKYEMPEYPDPNYDHDFNNYVGDICRAVKRRLAKSKTTEAEKNQYEETSVGREFKRFCSYVVYESILRIGACLRQSVERSGVKTISDAMVFYVLQQIHNVCGMDYNETHQVLTTQLELFKQWKETRKEERKNAQDKPSDLKTKSRARASTNEDAEDAEDAEDDEDDEAHAALVADGDAEEDEAEAEAEEEDTNEVVEETEETVEDAEAEDPDAEEVAEVDTEEAVEVEYDESA